MALTDLIDTPRLGRFLNWLKATFIARKASAIPMGQVDSTSTSTVYTAVVDGITELYDGVCVWLKNGVVTSAAGFTININNLGAKPVYGSLAAATQSTTIFNVSYTMLFIYNSSRVAGGCWDVVYGYDSNTNTIGYQLRTNSTTMPVSGATYRYRLLFTSADGKKYVPATTSTSTNATAARVVNQTKIDPFGAIRYYSTTTAVSSGSNPSASYLWEQYNLTLGYSFNRTGAALTLTTGLPVYIKCAPQADGSAIIDADTPYVQALPSAADGKIYIFLGIATAATTVELTVEHPVYCYRNSSVQRWTGIQQEIDTLSSSVASLLSLISTVNVSLTHCTISNSASAALNGQPYSATIIVDDGYDIDTVTVTMSEIDTTSSVYASGVINIPSVTGNIVITVTTVEAAPQLINLVDSIGISADTRLSTSDGGNRSPQSGFATVGANKDTTSLIHLAEGDVIRIKGITLPASNDNVSAIVSYTSAAAWSTAGYFNQDTTSFNNMLISVSGDLITITAPSGIERYIRVCGPCSDTSVVVVTRNQEIN